VGDNKDLLLRGGVLVVCCVGVFLSHTGVLVVWGCPHRARVFSLCGDVSCHAGVSWGVETKVGGVVCMVGVTLVEWEREEMVWRGLTRMTMMIICRHALLSSLVVCSCSHATSPMVRHCISSLTSWPSLFIVVMAHPEGTVDVPHHRHNVMGTRSVVGDVALHCGGGPSVLVCGGDGDGGHWRGCQ
jgi:hypothetical protein